MNKDPLVSIIIPSFDGYRNGNVPELLKDIEKQTFENYEIHIVKGVKPNGKSRNVGVAKAIGKILVFIDDDVRLGDDNVIKNLIEPLLNDKSIGITGTSRFLPLDANKFQRSAEKQLPRSFYPVVDKITESDMATHDCMAITRHLYIDIGQENELILRGTDPDLRARVRKAGKRVVIVPNTWIYHPLPKSYKELIKKSFTSAMGSGWVYKHYPELVFEVPAKGEDVKTARRSFVYRVIRAVLRLIVALITFKIIKMTYAVSYAVGYIYGMIASDKAIEKKVF